MAMTKKQINLGTTDDIIGSLKSHYMQGGMDRVVDWVMKTFRPGTNIKVSRDVTRPADKEEKTVYNRLILKLDKQGNETVNYHLKPVEKEMASSELFLSVRLHFIEDPFELLIYVE